MNDQKYLLEKKNRYFIVGKKLCAHVHQIIHLLECVFVRYGMMVVYSQWDQWDCVLLGTFAGKIQWLQKPIDNVQYYIYRMILRGDPKLHCTRTTAFRSFVRIIYSNGNSSENARQTGSKIVSRSPEYRSDCNERAFNVTN